MNTGGNTLSSTQNTFGQNTQSNLNSRNNQINNNNFSNDNYRKPFKPIIGDKNNNNNLIDITKNNFDNLYINNNNNSKNDNLGTNQNNRNLKNTNVKFFFIFSDWTYSNQKNSSTRS